MKKRKNYLKAAYWIFICSIMLTGCSDNPGAEEMSSVEDGKEEQVEEKLEQTEVESGNDFIETDTDTEDPTGSTIMEMVPETVYADWSEYFNGLNGAAVVYDVSERRYTMYHADFALVRRSPCSTFKIISSLIALENGIFEPEDSTREWSGEIFWNEDWNKDIDFS